MTVNRVGIEDNFGLPGDFTFSNKGSKNVMEQLANNGLIIYEIKKCDKIYDEMIIGQVLGVSGKCVKIKFIEKFKYYNQILRECEKQGLTYKMRIQGLIKKEHKNNEGIRVIDKMEVMGTIITASNPVKPVIS